MLSVYDGWWCPDITGEMVEVLAVVRLGLFSLIVVVVAGFRETGGLKVVGVEISCSAELSVLRESSSLLLLNTAAAATSHVGIFPYKLYSNIHPPPTLKFSKNFRMSVKITRSVPRYYENGVVSICKCLIIILKILCK